MDGRAGKAHKVPNGTATKGHITTAASAFFEALHEAGVKYCFVNLGSDHPGLLEAMATAKQTNSKTFPEIITCPSELVALSASLGYSQVTGIPQCVIVHVDCGTLAMGQSIHNASISRVPVLCFAGLSPFTQDGEMLGSRTEFIHWLQDVPDQAAIVRQYCRYSGEIKTGQNIKQMIHRSLQFATSDPKGPSYLMAAREVLEATVEVPPLDSKLLGPITLAGLPDSDVPLIANALISAKRPLVVTGYLGRNLHAPPLLVDLCNKLPIRVLETVGSDMCFPSDHEAYLGVSVATHPEVLKADVILVLDCDVPWIPTKGRPSIETKIFHLDVDPLKQQMPVFYINALRRYRASCETALGQLNAFIDRQNINAVTYATAFAERTREYNIWKQSLLEQEIPSPQGIIEIPYLTSRLRHHLPQGSVIVMEAVTNTTVMMHHLNLTEPGSFYGSGAGGLGWGGGATLGVKLAKPDSFVCGIVGDGTFLFSQMESVYWISRRYNIPFLMIVLNNGGWNAPKVSALHVRENGGAANTHRRDLNLSFDPSPDYPGIAVAAGNAWGATITEVAEVDSTLHEAINVVKGGRCAVVEAHVPSKWRDNLDRYDITAKNTIKSNL